MKKAVAIVLAVVAVAGGVTWFAFNRTVTPDPLSQVDIERAVHGQTLVVVAKVESRKIANPGTRSESAFYNMSVQEFLFGQTNSSLSVGRYTQNRKHYLSVGQKYVCLLKPGAAPGENTLGLRKFEPYIEVRVDTIRQWVKKSQRVGEPNTGGDGPKPAP